MIVQEKAKFGNNDSSGEKIFTKLFYEKTLLIRYFHNYSRSHNWLEIKLQYHIRTKKSDTCEG